MRVDGARWKSRSSASAASSGWRSIRRRALQAAGAGHAAGAQAGRHGHRAGAGLLGAASHWTGDTSGIRRIKSHGVGLVALLALPPQASGLSVFSQDGRIVRKLREDAALIEQELVADVAGTIAPNGLARLCRGLVIRGQGPAAGARELAERDAPALRGEGHRAGMGAVDVRAGGPAAHRAAPHPHRPRRHGGPAGAFICTASTSTAPPTQSGRRGDDSGWSKLLVRRRSSASQCLATCSRPSGVSETSVRVARPTR